MKCKDLLGWIPEVFPGSWPVCMRNGNDSCCYFQGAAADTVPGTWRPSDAWGGSSFSPPLQPHSCQFAFSSGRICHLLSWSPGILFCLRKALYSWGWLLPQKDCCLLGAVLWDLCLETQFQSFFETVSGNTECEGLSFTVIVSLVMAGDCNPIPIK